MNNKKITKKIILSLIIFFITISIGRVYGNQEEPQEAEYSEAYKAYLQLSDEEKAKVLEPTKYKIETSEDNTGRLKGLKNIFTLSNLLGSSLASRYTLQDVIPENMVVKDQGTSYECWAFAAIGSLESNLALQDYKSGANIVVYDYSEKHMDYATARYAFLNGKKNEYGVNRDITTGGNISYAIAYLTNGLGAIPESELKTDGKQTNHPGED